MTAARPQKWKPFYTTAARGTALSSRGGALFVVAVFATSFVLTLYCAPLVLLLLLLMQFAGFKSDDCALHSFFAGTAVTGCHA